MYESKFNNNNYYDGKNVTTETMLFTATRKYGKFGRDEKKMLFMAAFVHLLLIKISL